MAVPDLAAVMADLHGAAERIWMECEADWPGLTVEVLPEVDSTNTRLVQQGRQGSCHPSVLTAVTQTAGRGRMGRSWQARPGATLTCSTGLVIDLDRIPGGGTALSLAVGLAVAEALDAGLQGEQTDANASSAQPVGLKWPNDLWLGERKLGGILIEACPAPGLSSSERWVVIGLGLNVLPPPPMPEAACLPQAAQRALTVGTVWAWVVPALLGRVRQFVDSGFAPWQAAYARRDVLQGRTVQLTAGLGADQGAPQPALATGLCQGVDSDGALLVHTPTGLQRWQTGEVSVRPAPVPIH